MKKIIFGLFLAVLVEQPLHGEISQKGLKNAANYAIHHSGWPRNQPSHTQLFLDAHGEPGTKVVTVNLGNNDLRNGVWMKISYDDALAGYQTKFNISREIDMNIEEKLLNIAVLFSKRMGISVVKFVGNEPGALFQNLLINQGFQKEDNVWTLYSRRR